MDKKVIYASCIFDYRPLKEEKYRCRIVVGGGKLTTDQDTAPPEAFLTETEIIVNSTILDAHNGARFKSSDLK